MAAVTVETMVHLAPGVSGIKALYLTPDTLENEIFGGFFDEEEENLPFITIAKQVWHAELFVGRGGGRGGRRSGPRSVPPRNGDVTRRADYAGQYPGHGQDQ